MIAWSTYEVSSMLIMRMASASFLLCFAARMPVSLSRALSTAAFVFPDPADPSTVTDSKRNLGLLVCRGTTVMLVCPEDGYEEIANPFQV